MGPGHRHEFMVQHDIKELGMHTLVCSTVYTAADGERRYFPENFKFSSSNPLYVKTKVHLQARVCLCLPVSGHNATRLLCCDKSTSMQLSAHIPLGSFCPDACFVIHCSVSYMLCLPILA